MYLSRLCTFQNDRYACTFLCGNQMLLQSGNCKQGWDCHMVFIHTSVGQDDNVDTVTERSVHFYEQSVDRLLQTCIFIICDRNSFYLEAFRLHALDLHQVCIGQDRVVDLQHVTVLR